MGLQTAHNIEQQAERKYQHHIRLDFIVSDCYVNNIPLFMKSSLAEIWGEPLIQEFPIGLRRKE